MLREGDLGRSIGVSDARGNNQVVSRTSSLSRPAHRTSFRSSCCGSVYFFPRAVEYSPSENSIWVRRAPYVGRTAFSRRTQRHNVFPSVCRYIFALPRAPGMTAKRTDEISNTYVYPVAFRREIRRHGRARAHRLLGAYLGSELVFCIRVMYVTQKKKKTIKMLFCFENFSLKKTFNARP